MFEKMDLKEKTINSKSVFDGNLLKVYSDKITLPNGKESTREYIKHLGAVSIVALDENKNVIIEHQFRYPFKREIIEIPAGKLDSADEDPLEAAKRELREETGLTAKNWESLGLLYPSVAYTTEVIHMFLATGLSEGERELDEDESINCEFIPLKELVKMICNGEVGDSKTQAAILKTWLKTTGEF